MLTHLPLEVKRESAQSPETGHAREGGNTGHGTAYFRPTSGGPWKHGAPGSSPACREGSHGARGWEPAHRCQQSVGIDMDRYQRRGKPEVTRENEHLVIKVTH